MCERDVCERDMCVRERSEKMSRDQKDQNDGYSSLYLSLLDHREMCVRDVCVGVCVCVVSRRCVRETRVRGVCERDVWK